jgi:hypothetical protein
MELADEGDHETDVVDVFVGEEDAVEAVEPVVCDRQSALDHAKRDAGVDEIPPLAVFQNRGVALGARRQYDEVHVITSIVHYIITGAAKKEK